MGLRRQAIEEWMIATLGNGGIERFDDLHIDRIDPAWTSRARWIDAALEAHQIAVGLRHTYDIPVTVAAAFSLKASVERMGCDFHTRDEFEQRLDWSPPSLYLFRRGQELWVSQVDFQRLEDIVIGGAGQGAWWYGEFKPEGAAEYCRTVFYEG